MILPVNNIIRLTEFDAYGNYCDLCHTGDISFLNMHTGRAARDYSETSFSKIINNILKITITT